MGIRAKRKENLSKDSLYWCHTLNTGLPSRAVCAQLREKEMKFTRLFFWNLNWKLSRPGLSLHRPDWGEIEWRIWAERWSWPQPFFSPSCRLELRLAGCLARWEKYAVNCEHVVTSASVSLFSSTCICCDSLFPCTTCLEYSACTSIFFARALACACTHEVSHPFHFHLLCLLSYFSLLSFFFPAVVEILDVLACLLSSPHHLWAGSRRV